MTRIIRHQRQEMSMDMDKAESGIIKVGRSTKLNRRRTVVGAGLFVGGLLAASAAWACTLLVGTFTVCSPPSASFVNGAVCSQRTSVAGQVGLAAVSKNGSAISIVGTAFSTPGDPGIGTLYSITFQRPGAGGSCHAYNPDGGVTSLLGTNASGKPNTVAGPNFSVGSGTGAYPNVSTPSVLSTGTATVCVQDEPDRVDGNFVRVTVV